MRHRDICGGGEKAGIDLSAFPRHDAELRGRGEIISIFVLPDEADPFAKKKSPLEFGVARAHIFGGSKMRIR